MLIFFTLIVIVYSSGDDCGKRTKIYNNHEHKENNKENSNNDKGYYFVPETYVGSDSTLKCTKISDNSVFKKYTEKRIQCNKQLYQHCVLNAETGSWGCKSPDYNGNTECYNVEHIIPKKHNISELFKRDGEKCEVNIYSNLVMAYGAWNNALRHGHFEERKRNLQRYI